MRRQLAKDEGFTLIELMVVVLIIAILIAIAIPTFLGARERAQDRAAQSDLRNAYTAAKVFYVDNEDYSFTAATDLTDIEPSLAFESFTAGNDYTSTVAYVAGTDTVHFLKESASGTFFCIAELDTGVTVYGQAAAEIATAAACDTADAW